MKKQGYEPDTRHVHPRVTYFSPPSEVTHPRNITEPGGYEAVKKTWHPPPLSNFNKRRYKKNLDWYKPKPGPCSVQTLLNSDVRHDIISLSLPLLKAPTWSSVPKARKPRHTVPAKILPRGSGRWLGKSNQRKKRTREEGREANAGGGLDPKHPAIPKLTVLTGTWTCILTLYSWSPEDKARCYVLPIYL